MPTELSSAAQLRGIIQSNSLVIIDFHATWCPPCKAIAPVYEQLAGTYEKKNAVAFTKCDTDRVKEVAMQYNITAMPTFIFILNGKEVSRIRGADANQLRGDIIKFSAMAKPGSGAGFSGSGKKLGSEEGPAPKAAAARPAAKPRAAGAAPARAAQSGWLGTIVKSAIALGMLYFVTLFTLDPKGAADKWLRSNNN